MKLEKITKRNGMLAKTKFIEKPEELPATPKTYIRKDIREEVYDVEDAIADSFKLSLANMSMIYRLFLLTVQLYKDLKKEDELRKVIPEDLENAVNKIMNFYKGTNTILDLKIKEEGLMFMERILDRQGKVASIIEENIK